MSKRQPRTGPLSLLALRARLSERDLRILDHVGQLRLLAAPQIETLFFPAELHASTATAARRCRSVLERLARERVLVRLDRRIGGVRSGSASFVYALTSLGQRVLDQGGPRQRLSEPSERFVDHTLAVAEFLVQLSVEARQRQWELLEWQSEPASWREATTLGGRVTLRPDLFVVLGAGKYELRWFVEIDRGSEHSPALRRKCRLYHTYYKGGNEQRRHKVFPRVLWVVPDEHRAQRLRRLIESDPRLTTDLFRVTTSERALTAIGEAE